MSKYLEFIDPYNPSSANVFVRTEHLARYLYAAEFIGKRSLKRVLDAACGNGYGSRLLARRAVFVEGIDRNADLISAGISHAADTMPNVQLHAADLNEKLGYGDGEFDCVVCFETLEHVERDMDLLEEFRRVLRKGGTLLASVPKAGYEPCNDGKPENPYHLRLYSPDRLEAQLKDCGFQIERMLGQPWSNIARVRMEDYRRDTGASPETIEGFFANTTESLEFYARVWGWPLEECAEKSNTIFTICRRT